MDSGVVDNRSEATSLLMDEGIRTSSDDDIGDRAD